MNRVTGRLSRYLHIQVLPLLGSSLAPCATGIITLLMSTSPAVSLLIYIATGSASLGLVAANDRFWRKAVISKQAQRQLSAPGVERTASLVQTLTSEIVKYMMIKYLMI
jgi:hypothetical protein